MKNRLLALAVVFGIAAIAYLQESALIEPAQRPGETGNRSTSIDGQRTVLVKEAYADGVSGVVLEFQGEVDRLLADDNEGSRHQRFIVRGESDITVLISHNIDLAPRINALAVGDSVVVRGEYEWNERGGVIHWTHHDPAGRHEAGWIRHEGREYR